MIHGNLTQSDGLHSPFAWLWADSTERTAESPTIDDLNKIGLQEDTGIVYRLEDLTPTWTPFAGATAIGDLTDVAIVTPSTGDVLVYNSVSGDWENQPGGSLGTHTTEDAVTAAVTDVVDLIHESTGTPTAGFGVGMALIAENNATTNVKIGGVFASWETINTNSILGLTGYGSGATRLMTVRSPATATTTPSGLGEGAIDFQTQRATAVRTAQGVYSVIVGGRNNIITTGGEYSAIIGGFNNRVYGNYCLVTGYDNYIQAASGSFVAGYSNTMDGTASKGTIAGGQNNRIYNSTLAFVGGGYSNLIGAPSSYNVIVGGHVNQIQGTIYGKQDFIGTGRGNQIGDSVYSSILNGFGNQTGSGGTGANYATILNGVGNLLTANYATILAGDGVKADKHGQIVANGQRFAAQGDSQGTLQMTLSRQVTHSSTAAFELYLDGSAARMTIPANAVWAFHALVIGTNSGNTKRLGYAIEGVVSNNGVTTAILASTVTTLYEDDANFSAAVNTASGIFIIEVADSGASSDVIRWTATVRTAEVVYA